MPAIPFFGGETMLIFTEDRLTEVPLKLSLYKIGKEAMLEFEAIVPMLSGWAEIVISGGVGTILPLIIGQSGGVVAR